MTVSTGAPQCEAGGFREDAGDVDGVVKFVKWPECSVKLGGTFKIQELLPRGFFAPRRRCQCL